MHLATVEMLKSNTIHVNSTPNSHFLWSQPVNTAILGFRCVSTFCSSWTTCFVLVFAVFLTLTRNRMIVYFEAKQPTRVADKNIFSSDLPSCWITGPEKQSLFWKTKQNSTQIIPWVSFIVHYEFSAQHPVWMQCEIHVQYSGIQSFHVEVKKACMQYDTKVCSSRERTKHGPPVHGLPKWITQMDYPWKSFERRKTTVRSTPHNCSYHTLRVCFGNVPYMRSVSFTPYFGRHFEMTASADR